MNAILFFLTRALGFQVRFPTCVAEREAMENKLEATVLFWCRAQGLGLCGLVTIVLPRAENLGGWGGLGGFEKNKILCIFTE